MLKPLWFWRGLVVAFAGMALLCISILMLSRLFTDRTLITQYLYWIPLSVYGGSIFASSLLWAISRGLVHWMSTRRLRVHELAQIRCKTPRTMRVLPYLTCSFGAALIAMNALWLLPHHRTTPTEITAHEIRVLHWNLTSPDTHTWPGVITDIPECAAADVLLLGVTMDDEQFERVMRPIAGSHTIRRVHGLAIASRLPVLSFRHIDLRLDPIVAPGRLNDRSPEPWYQVLYNDHAESFGVSRREFDLPDPGFVIELTVQTTLGPRSIHFIDLPSNPFASRWRIAEAAAQRMKTENLSPPMLIMGDFNIPGGSISLKKLAEGFTSAATAATDSFSGPTWPRARAFLDIDHALLSAETRARVYRTFDPGLSDHCGQFLILTPPGKHSSESVGRD